MTSIDNIRNSRKIELVTIEYYYIAAYGNGCVSLFEFADAGKIYGL